MLDFLRHGLLKGARQTGAIAPSGAALARAMTASLRAASGPRRVLEVGPGTGAVTGHILRELRRGDSFDLVELNAEFCRSLEGRCLAPFRRRLPQVPVRVIEGAVEDVELESGYDFVLCALPFNNFPPRMMRSILRRLIKLTRPGGELCFFEYALLRSIKAPLASRAARERIRRIDATVRALRRRLVSDRELVLRNVPPAYAVRLRTPAA